MATAHAETQQTLETHKYIRLAIIAYKSQCVVEWRRRCYIWVSIILRSNAPIVLPYSYPRRMHFNVASLQTNYSPNTYILLRWSVYTCTFCICEMENVCVRTFDIYIYVQTTKRTRGGSQCMAPPAELN